MMKNIRAFVSTEEGTWTEHISMSCFRYNTSTHTATGMTPYRAVFWIEAFDFDSEAGRKMAIDQEAQSNEELAVRLKKLHFQLLVNGANARVTASKQYTQLVENAEYKVGDRVLMFNPRQKIRHGRKLNSTMIGPYVVEEPLSKFLRATC